MRCVELVTHSAKCRPKLWCNEFLRPLVPLLYPSKQFSFLTANLSDLRTAALLLSESAYEFDKFKSRVSLRKLTGARSIF
jgi:hypothetical protein